MDTYSRGDLTFDVLDEGPSGGPVGPVVVLLHGFPQHNTSWNTVIPRLTEEGYRCLAPNQRGYSRTARPRGRWNYRTSELVAYVCALIDASGARRVHLVGRRTFSPKLQDVNCVPWSECTIVEPQRFLLATAMLTALLTSAVSGVVENVRATIIREKQSRMAQQ